MKVQKTKLKRRKRRLKLLFGIMLFSAILEILLFSGFFGETASYATASKTEETDSISSETERIINSIDTNVFDEFFNSLSAEQKGVLPFKSIKEMLKALSNGESRDFFTSFWQALGKSASGYFAGFLPAIITIIVVCLLKNMLAGMTSDFALRSTNDVVQTVCYITVTIVLTVALTGVISSAVETIDNLSKFSSIMFPMMLTMLSALGSATGVATYQPMMAVLSGTITQIIARVIMPAFIACAVFAIVGNMSKTVKLTKITKLLRSGGSWLMGIVFGLFGTFLTVGGIAGGFVDRIGYNAAKFAVGSYVPILGGYLSDGFDLFAASMVLVKNALGFAGAALLVSIILFPLVKLVIFMLSLRIASAVVEPMGDERVSGMLSSVADNMSLLIAALIGIGFMFFLTLMLALGTGNPSV